MIICSILYHKGGNYEKKTIKATVSAVSIATAFAGISVVKAEDVTATQPNESALSVESKAPSFTNIKQVDGVFVNNGGCNCNENANF